ncbi:MAG: glycoside hydrolase family 3 C-terminal domain-containing protein [Treponema sp.]|jgi:beta-glucosidase|nr:glycoside hydrolase family 3 C-terminal domain-containing protein [Treponema sp.]
MTTDNRKKHEEKAAVLVAQMTTEEQSRQLLFNAPAIERLGIPEYNWWSEALHGVARSGTATVFPQAIALAATFDPGLLREIGDVIAVEGRAKYNAASIRGDRDIYKGLTFWSPNVNIFRDPRWGRGHETYGEDPYLSSRLGVAFIRGLQGEGEILKAAACVKHFAVHSGPESLRHKFDALVTLKDLWETYLPAFEACVVEAEVEAVMGAYNRTLGEPCCGSKLLLKTILREKWNFRGHVVSDCWAIRDFHEYHRVTASAAESAALALNSGCDVNCGCVYAQLMDAYEKALVTKRAIASAAKRLFTTRYKLGLIDGSQYDKISPDENDSPSHNALAVKAAEKAIVLLKNDGILPLRKEKLRRLAVIGPNANSRLALIGNYHGTASRYITVLEGIQLVVDNSLRIFYSDGCHLFRDRVEFLALPGDRLAEAEAAAKSSDAVILCLGLDETLEGEEKDAANASASGDKKDLLLPEPQRKLLERVVSVGKPVILCLMAGSAVDLQYADEHCAAILQCWYPGAQGGLAVAKILFGGTSPSGKLPVTFYRSTNDLPPFEDYAMEGRTYRYYRGEPLYPFGYGLTYGDVYCEAVESAEETTLEGIVLRITARNAGKTATEDVLQVYIKPLDSPLAPPNPSLCGFKRVCLPAGESRLFELLIDKRAFTVVDEQGNRIPGGKRYRFYAGFGQGDERTKVLTGHENATVDVSVG